MQKMSQIQYLFGSKEGIHCAFDFMLIEKPSSTQTALWRKKCLEKYLTKWCYIKISLTHNMIQNPKLRVL